MENKETVNAQVVLGLGGKLGLDLTDKQKKEFCDSFMDCFYKFFYENREELKEKIINIFIETGSQFRKGRWVSLDGK